MTTPTPDLLHKVLEYFESSKHGLLALGWLGVLKYAASLVGLQMAFIPLAVFAIAAGYIFGFWKGVFAITVATNSGAALNFLIARYVARGAVTRYLAHHEKFRLIDAAIGREGGKIIALLRLCPMPFGLANYCYGLTAVGFWPYFIATFVAIIPANCFFVWLGTGILHATDAAAVQHRGQYVILGVAAVAGFCALNYIARVAKAAVTRTEAAPDQAPVA